jgi:DNA polymerase-3 subunit epsilon
MILLSLDFETTGLDPAKDEVTEVGAVLWSTAKNRTMEVASYFVKTTVPISEEITKLTGVSQIMLDKFGYEQADGFQKLQDMIEQADAYVGQNVVRFDKRFYEAWAAKNKTAPIEKLWLDTRVDLPGVEGKHLNYMAADAGFVNCFPHVAVADCLTVLRLVSMHKIEDVVERAKSPVVILKADVSFENNALAKKRKYAWYPGAKMWWRAVKEIDLQDEIAQAPFNVSIVKDIPLETLWYQQ